MTDEYASLMNMHDSHQNQDWEKIEMPKGRKQVGKAQEPVAFYCLPAVPSMPREAVVLGAPAGEVLG